MISPRLGGIGLFEFHRAAELIERGAAAAERAVEEIAYELRLRNRVSERLSMPF
jgi:NTE family protein